jgi:hypothetical protein
MDMFGKQQAKCLFDEHIEELKRISRQKLIDERLIPIIEMLITDQKTKLSRYSKTFHSGHLPIVDTLESPSYHFLLEMNLPIVDTVI